jgi:hypothetical protein
MCPLNKTLPIVSLGEAHLAGVVDEPLFVPVYRELTERGPFGQEVFDRSRVGSFMPRSIPRYVVPSSALGWGVCPIAFDGSSEFL